MTGNAVEMETPGERTSACEIQQRFMQHSRLPVDGLDCSARCRQVQALGGDFYDFVPLPDDRLAIAVGDASGKGLPAALMVSNVQSSLRTASLFAGNNGPAVIDAVNRQVYESSLADRYATVFYCVFDSATRMLRYVNAGHNCPMVIRRDNSVVWLEAGGAPVGMFPDWKYQQGAVELRPGDVILAYTDGVIEATNPDGEEWGIEGLQNVVAGCHARSPEEMVGTIFKAADEFTHGVQTDDATVVAMQVH
jgi:sigma-B regulation protein RsbU (phosphoserine phosphatase)